MKTIEIPTADIVDWPSFHDVFSSRMGFFSGYGRNMDAWIDCMSDMDEPEGGLTSISLEPGEDLVILLIDTDDFSKRLPSILLELIRCTEFVNERYLARAGARRIVLEFS